MQVYGNIGSEVTPRKGRDSGKEFWTFRLAENQGKDENRTTTWYEIAFFGSQVDADLLQKGQFVKVTGRLDASVYPKRDGTHGASLRVTTGSVEVVPKREGGDAGDNSAPARAAAPAAAPRAAAPAAAPASAPATGPAERPASSFDDFDDDIPF